MRGHLLRIKRVYDPPDDEDGTRILVDRLWPRGVARERAQMPNWRSRQHSRPSANCASV